MINQLPILNLVLLLLMAILIPFLKKLSFKATLWIGGLVLLMVLTSAIFILIHVTTVGDLIYRFGNYEAFLGIEFKVDPFAAFFTLFVGTLAFIIYVYSSGDKTEGIESPEFSRYYVLYFLMLFAMFGILYTNDLFNTYVFIEIISLTSCAIISIKRKKEPYPAAFRYVMLNEIGSLSYLLGVAMLYMISGQLNIDLLAQTIQSGWTSLPVNIIFAIVFMTVGLGLKAAIFPFHIWLPDAHASAPSTSSAILSAVVVKIYILVLIKLMLKVFGVELFADLGIDTVLLVFGGAGMIMGSIFALTQKDLKRMLGYSSVSQIGYIVVGLALMSDLGLRSAFFHIVSHGLTKAALFLSVGIVIYLKKSRSVKGFDGLGFQMPIAMSVFGIAAFSMIGIPLTGGFIAKWNLGIAVENASQYIFLGVIVVSSLLNALYYLPILYAAFLKDNPEHQEKTTIEKIPAAMLLPIIVLGLGILVIGIYPNLLMQLIDLVIARL
jgi:multicomponent Na+:H+ antiporter subunit D